MYGNEKSDSERREKSSDLPQVLSSIYNNGNDDIGKIEEILNLTLEGKEEKHSKHQFCCSKVLMITNSSHLATEPPQSTETKR